MAGGPDREDLVLQEAEVLDNEGFLNLSLSRSTLLTGVKVEDVFEEGEELSDEEREFYQHVFNYLSSVARIPEVTGVILREDPGNRDTIGLRS